MDTMTGNDPSIVVLDETLSANPMFTYESFAEAIEKICEEHDMNHIEAICHFCEEHDIDVTEITPLINRSMKEKIKIVAQENGMMKRESMLPI